MSERSGYRNGRLIYPISILDHKPQEGGGSQPGPNTVGTDEIIDGSVEMQDLSDGVKDKMTIIYDDNDEGIALGGIAKPGDLPSSNAR